MCAFKFEKPKKRPEEVREQCSGQREQHMQKPRVQRKFRVPTAYKWLSVNGTVCEGDKVTGFITQGLEG